MAKKVTAKTGLLEPTAKSDTPDVEAPKATPSESTVFGVYQKPQGSHTAVGKNFAPLTATPCSAGLKKRVNAGRVKFFDSGEKASEEIARLREEFDSKPKG